MKILFFSSLIFVSTQVIAGRIEQRNEAIERTNSEISYSSKNYQHGDTVKLIANGNLASNGECSPDPLWGLLVKMEKEWKTLINVKALPQMLCGLGEEDFKNKIVAICVIDTGKLDHTHYERFFTKGEYKFTVLSGNRQHLIESNSFTIE